MRPAPALTIRQDIGEEDFKAAVIDAAHWYRWLVHHSRPARTGKGWRTPIQGDPGLPDLVLARGGVVLLAELKTNQGYPTPPQRTWLAAASLHGRLWRPRNWPQILEELSGPVIDTPDYTG